MKNALLIKQELDRAIPSVEDVPLDWGDVLRRSAEAAPRPRRWYAFVINNRGRRVPALGQRFTRRRFVQKRLVIAASAALIALTAGLFSYWNLRSGGTELAAAAVRIDFSSSAPGSSTGSIVVNVVRAMQARMDNENAAVVGGSAEQRELLRTILSNMPNNSLTRVEIVPKEFMGTTGVSLDFTVLSGDLPRSDWEEMLVAGAFRVLSADRELTPVVGYPGDPNWAPEHPSLAETLGSVEAKIRDAAADAGAEIVQLQIYKPDGIAPAVILEVDDPGPFLVDRLPRFLDVTGLREDTYEGSFVEVVDSRGAFVWEAGLNVWSGNGSVGTRPDFSGCSPIVNGGGFQKKCPFS